MFERILKDPKALARHQNGPLAEERRRYLFHCAAKEQTTGETLHGLANYLLVIAEALRLDKRPGELISPDEVDAEVHRWIHRPRPKNVSKLQIAFRNRAVRWLTYLGRMQPAPSVQRPFADYVAQFTEHLCQERGLAPKFPSMAKKRVSPHTIRHTTATHLLRAGVDINTIRSWLGHVCLSTTIIYAEVDMEMKAKALASCEIQEKKAKKHWRDDKGLMGFLERL